MHWDDFKGLNCDFIMYILHWWLPLYKGRKVGYKILLTTTTTTTIKVSTLFIYFTRTGVVVTWPQSDSMAGETQGNKREGEDCSESPRCPGTSI